MSSKNLWRIAWTLVPLIYLTIKSGGLKSVQIQDDGCGIRTEDLAVVCERFTTSKLRRFEDLQSLASYGFRGEALASVSHVAHLSITTKTAHSPVAYKAHYTDGKLREPPTRCAGNKGTTITVEDIFYNVPLRRKAISSFSEEQAKIVDVLSRYAVHRAHIGFSLKRHAECALDVRTPPNSTQQQNIALLFNPALANQLLQLELKDDKLGFQAIVLVSNPNFSAKRFNFLLFVNDRLVANADLKRALELLFAQYLPKHQHPFVYLSLQIPPNRIDVNVHPTKQEVHFLNEPEIVQNVCDNIDAKLKSCNESRAYVAHSLLPAMDANDVISITKPATCQTSAGSNVEKAAGDLKDSTSSKRPYAHQLVRTDCMTQKLDSFIAIGSAEHMEQGIAGESVSAASNDASEPPRKLVHTMNPEAAAGINEGPMDLMDASTSSAADSGAFVCEAVSATPAHLAKQHSSLSQEVREAYGEDADVDDRRPCNLLSVSNLRKRVQETGSKPLRKLIKNHTFVGCVDPKYALVQYSTGLYMTDTEKLTAELFYQAILYRFMNFGSLVLSEPASIAALLTMNPEFDSENLKKVLRLISSRSDLLKDYFSLEIRENQLISLPLIISDYSPQLAGLPEFMNDLGTKVNWESEEICLDGISRCLANFFAFKRSLCLKEDNWKYTVEHILYPALRMKLIPPANSLNVRAIVKLTDLQDLYKVFERC